MKSIYLIVSVILLSGSSLKAQEKVYERAYVHTDKDFYIAGEDLLLKFYVIDTDFQPSDLSKVGYVEICNTERPHIQLKIALEKGHGAGKIRIPTNIPSGVYELSGYTRYMRNEGENVFFKKQIAIVNAGQLTSDTKRFEIVEQFENNQEEGYAKPVEKEPVNLLLKTNFNEYENRKEVLLRLDNIPDNTADLVISVSRNDSIVFVPEINKPAWLKQVGNIFSFSKQWIPEYEGHIITGRIIPQENEQQLLANISFLGEDIRYIMGQLSPKKETVNFYTAGIYGKQQIVATAVSQFYDKVQHRIDLLSPFCESFPESLPVLQIYSDEKQLMERYLGVQIQGKVENDSLNNISMTSGYCTFLPVKTYDLDEYTRFSTLSETILEFVSRIHVTRLRGNRVISAFYDDGRQFSMRTLVLLDGIPIYNHEDILQYNPMYLKMINIYDGRYKFGNEDYECIVSFTTREGNLPFFQLGEESQLFDYDCPQLPPSLEFPDYSDAAVRNSRKPDFRHTLYWNPFVEFDKGQPLNLSFYTSDLCGEFKVRVEGITTDGKMVYGDTYFKVAPPRN